MQSRQSRCIDKCAPALGTAASSRFCIEAVQRMDISISRSEATGECANHIRVSNAIPEACRSSQRRASLPSLHPGMIPCIARSRAFAALNSFNIQACSLLKSMFQSILSLNLRGPKFQTAAIATPESYTARKSIRNLVFPVSTSSPVAPNSPTNNGFFALTAICWITNSISGMANRSSRKNRRPSM